MGNEHSPSGNTPAERTAEEVAAIFLKGVQANYYHIDTPEEREPQTVIIHALRNAESKQRFIEGGYKLTIPTDNNQKPSP